MAESRYNFASPTTLDHHSLNLNDFNYMARANLTFQLPQLEEIIESNPLTTCSATLVVDALAQMNREPKSATFDHQNGGFSRSSYILILKQSQLIGVLTEQDIVKLSATRIDLKQMTVGEVMTKDVITLKQNDFQDIYQVMSIFRRHHIRHLPVVDDRGHLAGIISTESICRALSPSNMLKMRSLEDTLNTQVPQAYPNSSVLYLSQLMAEQRQSCVVIVESHFSQDNLESFNCSSPENSPHLPLSIPIGIVTERDIVQFQILGLDLAKTKAKTVMSTPLVCMKPTDSLLDAQQQMKRLRVRRLVVAEESGELRGMITNQDMLRIFDTTELYEVINTLKQELNNKTEHLEQEIKQRQQSEFRLRENQQILELFVRHAPAAIAMLDRDMRYLVVSDRWIEDYQLEDRDIINHSHYEVFPEVPPHWRPTYQDCLAGNIKVFKQEEDSFVRLDGRVEWLRWELRPWHNLAGNIGGLLMFSEVITERKQLEQKLQSSEIQMRRMFEAMTDLVLTIDIADNSIQILPTKFFDLYSNDISNQIVEQVQAQLFNCVEAEHYQNLIRCVVQTQQATSFEYSFNLDDSLVWFNVHISYLSETTIIWVARNINHRKQMEQNLFAEKELAQVTLKSIGDAVITTDALGQVKYVNPIAEQLTGWRTEEAQQKPLAEIFQIINQSNREPINNPVDLVLKENRIGELAQDTVLIARNGTEYAIEDSAAPIQDRQGKLIGAVIVFRNVTQSRKIAQELSWQATHDPLTGLYNRRKFEEQLALVIEESQNHKSNHTLCYLDLDRFKIVNDTYGHAAGDELLQQVTKLLKKRIRASDIFARLGGDEFALLLHQCPLEIAPKIAEQLRQLIQDFPFTWEDKVFRIGASIGLVAINSTTDNLSDLLSTADAACYAAKEKGRNCVHVYHQQDTIVAQQRGERRWIEKLNRALEENRFCLYAQKIVSIEEDCDSHHYEILLRLIDESGKLIAPGAFLPAAERYDLMPAIDRWVVTNFLAGYEVYCRWRKEQKLQPPTNLYTINLSGASINNHEFGNFLQDQFECYSIPSETICFEITETVAISNLDNAVS